MEAVDDAVRGFSGGMLFGIPLLFTMEVWWIGSHTTPAQMALVLLVTFVVVFLLDLTGGFKGRDRTGVGEAVMDTVEAVAIGIVSAAAVLLLLRRIGPGVPSSVALGKVVYEALPFAIGVALARHFLSGNRTEGGEDGDGGTRPAGQSLMNETAADLGAAATGAVFVALNIAPTDEVAMLAAALGPPFLLAVVAVSLLASYAIVFVAGFSDHEKRRSQEGMLQSPVTETLASYLVALTMSGLMLFVFQNLDPSESWATSLGKIVVLGLPAAVGGAAGRLAV